MARTGGAGWLFEDAAEVVAKDGAEVPAGDMQLCP